MQSIGAPWVPPEPCRAPGAAIQPIAEALWPSQATPDASAFMAPPAWPMYMPSYMPRPPAQKPLKQAEFEEFDRQGQYLEPRELKVQHMTRTHNLNAVRDAKSNDCYMYLCCRKQAL